MTLNALALRQVEYDREVRGVMGNSDSGYVQSYKDTQLFSLSQIIVQMGKINNTLTVAPAIILIAIQTFKLL